MTIHRRLKALERHSGQEIDLVNVPLDEIPAAARSAALREYFGLTVGALAPHHIDWIDGRASVAEWASAWQLEHGGDELAAVAAWALEDITSEI